MSQWDAAAFLPDVAPSGWTTVCVLGAPAKHHRARQHVRLSSGAPATMILPVYLAPAATRIQIEIESEWPAVVTIDEAALAVDAAAPFVLVRPERFEIFNGNRVEAQGGTGALCVAGRLTLQITGTDPKAFGAGARLRLRVRRIPAQSLGPDDPVMAEFSRPERAVRSSIERLRARVEAAAR